ncbi:LLM class flavin-dependent oxidoreductase [Ferrovibrio sp.]|uniref:LLM class flavin-dependent oxidoreductase n=1 Tax=Ferrovibrio sp. TaxID=1917215 RepID=UPI001B4E5FC3|nr:TIGR03619 family F420-dependent LLM class oxidoreductase [Ferrovibrio sp.]MBP7063273.1 TIGR03619 family F420-dependent LLM class oxidoreductase [Ferrovibrio sp.]
MKFSICLPTGFEGVMYPIPFVKPEDFVRLGVMCEKLGYDSVWGNDHITTQKYVAELFPNTPPNFYEPLITLTAIGAATTKLRLGTALLVLPMRDPVYLAKQLTTLDQLTNGRFVMAVGLGAYREEFAAWNSRLASARRGDMLDEGIEALLKLLYEKSASHEGKFYAFKDVEMFPKAKQDPFPLFIGGHNIEAVERAARIGHGWLPGWRPLSEMKERIELLRRRTAENGRDPMSVEVAPQFSFTIAKTMEEAERIYMESGLVAHRKSLAYTGRDLSQQVVANLVGSADVILEKIAYLKSIGVDHCSALMIPADNMSEFEDQVQWFAEDVMRRVPA